MTAKNWTVKLKKLLLTEPGPANEVVTGVAGNRTYREFCIAETQRMRRRGVRCELLTVGSDVAVVRKS